MCVCHWANRKCNSGQRAVLDKISNLYVRHPRHNKHDAGKRMMFTKGLLSTVDLLVDVIVQESLTHDLTYLFSRRSS